MPLTSVQKGAIGQFAFLVTALATGKGELEVYTPAADNEGRDAEVRRHLKFLSAIGIQIKIAFALQRSGRYSRKTYLEVRFQLAPDRIQNDPRLWYFFAVFDASELRFYDQVFLIPASVLYKMAVQGKTGRLIKFHFSANVSPGSHDRFTPFRLPLRELGPRLLKIIDEGGLTASSGSLPLGTDTVVVGRRRGVVRRPRRLRVARPRKYDLIRNAVLGRDSVSALYQGHLRLFSPFLLGTKRGDPHVLGYQFGGTSEKPLGPEGDTKNWRCLRVAGLTKVKLLPGTWHAVPKGKGIQHCIDQVDVRSDSALPATRVLRRAA